MKKNRRVQGGGGAGALKEGKTISDDKYCWYRYRHERLGKRERKVGVGGATGHSTRSKDAIEKPKRLETGAETEHRVS